MVRHRWEMRGRPGPAAVPPGRVRVKLGRGATLCLLLGVVLWIAFSLLFHPVTGAGSELGTVELKPHRATDSHSSAPSVDAPGPSADAPGAPVDAAGPSTEASGAPGSGEADGNEAGAGAAPSPVGPGDGAAKASDAAGAGAAAPGAAGADGQEQQLVVHVAGAVKKPGVYAFPPGTRANSAVQRAGGLLADADASAVNLAAALADGQQLYIPSRGEPVANGTGSPGEGNGGSPGAAAGGGTGSTGGTSGPGGTPGSAMTGSPLNVNAATDAQLQELPGIGPALAGRIIAFREGNGPFASLAELDAVSGIGPAMLEKLAPHLVFR